MLNTLIKYDCVAFMRDLVPDNYVNLTVTSPPYDKLREYNGFCFDFENTIKELFRITKPGGVVVWVVGDQTEKGSESGSSFRQALYFMDCGFKLHDTMIYAKLNFIPQTHKRYEQSFEYMFVFVKGKISTFNPIKEPAKTAGQKIKLARKGYGFKEGSFRRREEEIVTSDFKTRGNIFYYACGASGKNHPAVFPEQLATDHILSWTNELDVVFDPFSGSGTTLVAAKKLDRYYVGCDISQQYVDDAKDLLNKVDSILDFI